MVESRYILLRTTLVQAFYHAVEHIKVRTGRPGLPAVAVMYIGQLDISLLACILRATGWEKGQSCKEPIMGQAWHDR